MERFFNTAGPIQKENHYYVEPLSRINMDEIHSLINQQKYFVLHAPRQTGKTSYLLSLMELLNKEGQYKCLYTNIEAAQAARENVREGMRAILGTIAGDAVEYLGDTFLEENWLHILEESHEFTSFQSALTQWTRESEKPIVLFIDGVDSLVGDTLISLLRQLRAGYTTRNRFFPQSIILCGVRDVKDYRIYSDQDKSVITGGSAFNIKAASIRLNNFSLDEIETLFEQHTETTGQKINNDVFPFIWELTDGHPWLVNALGYETCFKMEEGRDREKEITADIIHQAKVRLIRRHETHLDHLTDKLKEDHVRRIIEYILSGSDALLNIPVDDIDYAEEHGLIKARPQLRIANPFYREYFSMVLNGNT